MENFISFYLTESEKTPKKLLNLESSIDFPATETLNPEIWEYEDNQYHLRQTVRTQLQHIVDKMPVWVIKEIHIIGSLTSNLYVDDTDLDLHFIVDPTRISSEKLTELNKTIRTTPEVMIGIKKDDLMIGSHPIELYFQADRDQDLENFGCYDFNNDVWITPPDLVAMSYNPYEKFADVKSTVEFWGEKITVAINKLKTDLIDLDVIKRALKKHPSNEKFAITLNKKEKAIIRDLENIKTIRAEMVDIRKKTKIQHRDEHTAKRDDDVWQKNNAIFKFFGRYGFLKITMSLVDEYDKILELGRGLTKDNVNTLKQVLNI